MRRMSVPVQFQRKNMGGMVPLGRKLHLRGLLLRLAWLHAGLRAACAALLYPHGRARGAL